MENSLAKRELSPLAGEVLLLDVAEADLSTFYEHQSDPEANHVAAFPAGDRAAFMAHWSGS